MNEALRDDDAKNIRELRPDLGLTTRAKLYLGGTIAALIACTLILRGSRKRS